MTTVQVPSFTNPEIVGDPKIHRQRDIGLDDCSGEVPWRLAMTAIERPAFQVFFFGLLQSLLRSQISALSSSTLTFLRPNPIWSTTQHRLGIR
jgi:hypothetical protein